MESLDWGRDTTNRHVVGGVPGYGFHPLLELSREWRPCLFPIMAKLGINSFAHTPGASGLILMYLVYYGFSFKPTSSSSTQISQDSVKMCKKVVVKHSIIVPRHGEAIGGGDIEMSVRPSVTPVGTLWLDAPALVWVRSPNDGNKLGWS